MNVLNISWDDYANFSYENCQALKAAGINAKSVKRMKHAFRYENECEVVRGKHEIHRLIDWADVVQLMHSYPEFLTYAVSAKKRVFVYHTGTPYRMNPKNMNSIFNEYVERSFTDQCEFMGLGAKNPTYIATAINTDVFRMKLRQPRQNPVIGHFPSNSNVKGTAKILEMLQKVNLPYDLNYSTDRVPHTMNIKRMHDCDIYIEMFATEQNGRQYGCYGVTAFEAAAMGKVVVTNNIFQNVYSDAYGECALRIANTESEFIDEINFLLSLNVHDLRKIQGQSRTWILQKHSHEATGEYLKKFL